VTLYDVETMEEATPYRLSKSLGEVLLERADELERRLQDKDKYKPTPTHIPALNKIIGGFPVDPFMMLLFAAEKLGKTTIAMDLADAWRKAEEPVLYVQLEELTFQYADRYFSTHTNITKNDIRDLNIKPEQIREMREFAKSLKESGKDHLYLQDDLFVLEAIFEEAKRMEIKRIVIDNMSLFDLTSVKGSGEREKLVALTNLLVKYRNKEGFSFIVVSHEGGNNKAYGSSHLNKAADIIIQIEFAYQEATEDSDSEPVKIPDQRCLHVLPSRLCDEGRAYVTFDGSKNKIGPIAVVKVDDPDFVEMLQREQVPQIVGLPLLGQGV
jgi:KaiC/GvpD/RAD55 family RecA-like ATPase